MPNQIQANNEHVTLTIDMEYIKANRNVLIAIVITTLLIAFTDFVAAILAFLLFVVALYLLDNYLPAKNASPDSHQPD